MTEDADASFLIEGKHALLRRTLRMGRVREILTHPAIYPWITEDGAPEPTEFEPVDDDLIHYVEVFKRIEGGGETSVGVYMLMPLYQRCMEIHTNILPQGYGQVAHEAIHLLQAYAFAGTDPLADKLVSRVPEDNRRALSYATVTAGFQVEGVNRASYLRGGKLLDQTWVGLTRAEWLARNTPGSPGP